MTYLPNGNAALKARVPYKISAISGGYVANYGLSGNIIYGYIEFYSTGSITFQKSTTVNALIVGGGGGGGGNSTGGYNGSNSSAFGSTAYGGGGGTNQDGTYINSAATVGSAGGTASTVSGNRSVPTAAQGNYGGYKINGGYGGGWGYGTWAAWGAGGGYNNSPATNIVTWSVTGENASSATTGAMCVGGESKTMTDYDPINVVLFNTAGSFTKYKIENKALLSDPSWDNYTSVTNSQVGTIFKPTANYIYDILSPAYVSVVRSYGGGGGAPSGGSAYVGNAGGYGSGGSSGHSTWGNGNVGAGSGRGGTGGGGAGSMGGSSGGCGGGGGGVLSITVTADAGTAYSIVVGAGGSGGQNGGSITGGSGGSGIVIVKYVLIDMSNI